MAARPLGHRAAGRACLRPAGRCPPAKPAERAQVLRPNGRPGASQL